MSEDLPHTAAVNAEDSQQNAAIGRLQLMDKVQLVIAVAAILVSVASFYVAWKTSESEAKQVKAATWPYLHVEHGNYDSDLGRDRITYVIRNGGVGPALIKSFTFSYKGFETPDPVAVIDHCCLDDGVKSWSMLTNVLAPHVLTPGEEIFAFALDPTEDSKAFYETVNRERWALKARACYCSLLGECYETDFTSEPRQVAMCPLVPTQSSPPATVKPTEKAGDESEG